MKNIKLKLEIGADGKISNVIVENGKLINGDVVTSLVDGKVSAINLEVDVEKEIKDEDRICGYMGYQPHSSWEEGRIKTPERKLTEEELSNMSEEELFKAIDDELSGIFKIKMSQPIPNKEMNEIMEELIAGLGLNKK